MEEIRKTGKLYIVANPIGNSREMSPRGKQILEEVDIIAAEEEAEEFKIVRSKRFSIKPMSVEEAILQMNLLGHEFFVFKNMDAEDAFSVVYKRKQGGYGLICDDGLNAD